MTVAARREGWRMVPPDDSAAIDLESLQGLWHVPPGPAGGIGLSGRLFDECLGSVRRHLTRCADKRRCLPIPYP